MWVRYVKCGFFKKGHRTPGDLLLLSLSGFLRLVSVNVVGCKAL